VEGGTNPKAESERVREFEVRESLNGGRIELGVCADQERRLQVLSDEGKARQAAIWKTMAMGFHCR